MTRKYRIVKVTRSKWYKNNHVFIVQKRLMGFFGGTIRFMIIGLMNSIVLK